MAVPQISFKLRIEEDETDKAIYKYLSDKPKTYIIKQALLQYMAIENNRDALAKGLISGNSSSNARRDELEDFEL